MRKSPSDRTVLLTCFAALGAAALGARHCTRFCGYNFAQCRRESVRLGRMVDDRTVLRDQELVAAGGRMHRGRQGAADPHSRDQDGKAAFVETQTARNDNEHSYSYTFLSSPLPVSNYTATIKVTAKGDGFSTVTWSGSYTPDQGKEKAANEALIGVYEVGLAEIKAKLAK